MAASGGEPSDATCGRRGAVRDVEGPCEIVVHQALRTGAGGLSTRPYLCPAFGSGRLFGGFASEGVLVQSADFWSNSSFWCKAGGGDGGAASDSSRPPTPSRKI